MNAASIKNQREALEKKLKILAEKQRMAVAKERKEFAIAEKKTFEKNKAALGMVLLRHHVENFTNFDLDSLKKEITAILKPEIKKNSTAKQAVIGG